MQAMHGIIKSCVPNFEVSLSDLRLELQDFSVEKVEKKIIEPFLRSTTRIMKIPMKIISMTLSVRMRKKVIAVILGRK